MFGRTAVTQTELMKHNDYYQEDEIDYERRDESDTSSSKAFIKGKSVAHPNENGF